MNPLPVRSKDLPQRPRLRAKSPVVWFALFSAVVLFQTGRVAWGVDAPMGGTACNAGTAVQMIPVNAPFSWNPEPVSDPALQTWLEQWDAALRGRWNMRPEQTAAGVLDLRTGRLAMLRPDRMEYAASVAKIGILLAWLVEHPEEAAAMPANREHELGRIAKCSSNELAAQYSRAIGLKRIQEILNERGFYDEKRGGGLWVGRHYGSDAERYGDPIHDHSHGATVRQVLRFFQEMEQDVLLPPDACATLRRIFDAPALPHDDIKFVKGLQGRPVQLRRKWGTWQDWKHDAAAVTGPGRHYILAALTHHPEGDAYLEAFAAGVDDQLMGKPGRIRPSPSPLPAPPGP